MPRQTFTEGQIVWCKRYGNVYKKAIVLRPDMVQAGQRTHYVGVQYINANDQPEGAEWPTTNRANLILTEEAFNEIKRAKNANRLRRDIAAYAHFERDFQPYFEQAEIICRTLVGHNEPDDVAELAHYLRGMFSFTSSYSRLTRDGVRTLRLEKHATAAIARAALVAMGENAPELAKEAGA